MWPFVPFTTEDFNALVLDPIANAIETEIENFSAPWANLIHNTV